MSEITLSADGERALKEAESACWRANVAIVAPEHLLGGALLVMLGAGEIAVPSAEQVEAAMLASQGMGSEALDKNVMFGSAARAAINFTAAAVRNEGGNVIDARALVIGTIASDEVNPMFFGTLGMTRLDLLQAVGAFGD